MHDTEIPVDFIASFMWPAWEISNHINAWVIIRLDNVHVFWVRPKTRQSERVNEDPMTEKNESTFQ